MIIRILRFTRTQYEGIGPIRQYPARPRENDEICIPAGVVDGRYAEFPVEPGERPREGLDPIEMWHAVREVWEASV